MTIEEAAQLCFIPLADLPQHPAHGLVDQIMFIAQQAPRDAQRIAELVLPDVMQGGRHRNASLPETGRAAQRVEQLARSPRQVRSQDQVRGTVDEVPVVHPLQVVQVQLGDARALAYIALPEIVHENHQCQQSRLMPWRLQQRAHLRQRQIGMLAGQHTHLRHRQAEESISLSVLAGRSAEESQRLASARGAADAAQLLFDLRYPTRHEAA